MRKINQRFNTEGVDSISTQRRYDLHSPKLLRNSNVETLSINDFQVFPQKVINESQTLIPAENATFETKIAGRRKDTDVLNRINQNKKNDKTG